MPDPTPGLTDSIPDNSILGLLTIIPQGKIEGILIDATFRERHISRLEMTSNPVEIGSPLTDHSFNLQDELEMECGWSNASSAAVSGAISAITQLFSGGSLLGPDYVSGVYSRLKTLKESREVFSVTTTLRTYDSILMTLLELERDVDTSQALMVRAQFKQAILAQTQEATLPPQLNQADPARTAEVQDQGTVQPVLATPSPGGSAPPSTWTQTAPK